MRVTTRGIADGDKLVRLSDAVGVAAVNESFMIHDESGERWPGCVRVAGRTSGERVSVTFAQALRCALRAACCGTGVNES
eukprot:4822401-Alexandrium_andersonii.AAC.1